MQITDLAAEQKILPVLRLGFRPFFLAGALFSMVALLLWGAMLSGYITFQPYGGGLWWHIHEMLFGFGCAIVAGFLLTAIQNWTGVRGISGLPLLGLFMLWLAGRIALFLPSLLNDHVIMLIDLSFLPVVAYVLAKPLLKIKQYRNLFFVPLLVLFTVANIEMHLAKLGLANMTVNQAAYASVMLMAFLMSVMAGRVVPMFTANGTKTTKVLPLPWLEKLATGSLGVITLLLLIQPLFAVPKPVFGILFILAACCQAIRWCRWKPWITLGVPLLWSIHGSLFFIWAGLFTVGMSYFINVPIVSHLWHFITIGGMGGLILAMISRVSLGHTGRMLQQPKAMFVAFFSIFIAVIIRVIGPIFWMQYYIIFINLSIVFWLIAFGLFAYHYAPMLFKARQDGRPG
ncbi:MULTISPECIES: NnrS family protein [unclassified Moritella]|uniref:NnrS family protein n=1 Tax=unclassified Moritella TaxID=2637987 RepID=UPI001BAB3CDF|nr:MULTISPECIES: NnrS family protein [unclassified Moritella]QUM85479.1 NnrS family protein [Moritella sp. 28]QUM89697.1 NnrS family protein [Moritella sp. 36]